MSSLTNFHHGSSLRTFAWTTAIASLMVAGCGGSSGSTADIPATAPVTGIVTYKGQPVKDAQVVFHPTGQGNPASGSTEANGRFTLTTYQPRDGAVPGFHVVTVKVMPIGGLPGAEIETTGGTAIPKKYAEQSTSPLTLEVKPQPNNLEIVLED